MPSNLESDLLSSRAIREKVQTSDVYAQNLYAALCNNIFQKNDVISRLKDDVWSCSWRYAGGLVAEIKGHGDYLDYYCSFGLKTADLTLADDQRQIDFRAEGDVADSIRQDLFELGWVILPPQQDIY